jgi:nucleotide-binding universal stress UspA family protein
MIKTILVAASGGRGDASAFETALTLARPLAAHLAFYHAWTSPDDAAAFAPHVDFAQGPALKDALDRLQRDAETRSTAAARLFHEFCDRHRVPIADPDENTTEVTASWIEEKEDAIRGLTRYCRHHDLIVVGPPSPEGGLRPELAGQLLLACGRPLVLAPPTARTRQTGTIVVGWNETPEAARALTAATPFLHFARRIVLASVEDGRHASAEALDDLAQKLRRHGAPVDVNKIEMTGRTISECLQQAAEAFDADLLVVGAYGHTRIWELIFGGVTRSLLEGGGVAPVFLTH